MLYKKSYLGAAIVLGVLISSMMPHTSVASEVDFRYIMVVDKSDIISAPPATWVDLSGNQHSLDEFKGKPVVLHFWASWCPPCRSEFTGLDAWNKAQVKGQGISLIALSGDSSIGRAAGFIRDGGYDIPVRLTNDETQEMWMIRSIPTTYFIDASGQIRGIIFGATDWSNPQLQKEVGALLSIKKVEKLDARTALTPFSENI